jgi:uncharacterized membrane protein YgcG
MKLATAVLAVTLSLTLGNSAIFQTLAALRHQGSTDAIVQRQLNNTDNDLELIIAPGATGADTITIDSAAGSNSRRPERAVPNSGAKGGGGSAGGG